MASTYPERVFAVSSIVSPRESCSLFDVPPPENDSQAHQLASKIKKWISDGRPKPGDVTSEENEVKEPKKKKSSLFGRFSK